MKKTTKKTTKRVVKTTKKATAPKQTKLQSLKTKERESARKMKDCVNSWDAKLKKAKTTEQKSKVNARFKPKFNKLDKLHSKRVIDVQICQLQNERKRLG